MDFVRLISQNPHISKFEEFSGVLSRSRSDAVRQGSGSDDLKIRRAKQASFSTKEDPMPRPKRIQPKITETTLSDNERAYWHDVARLATELAKQQHSLSKATQKEYENRWKRLCSDQGWDMGRACKNERYLMRAAGIYAYKSLIRKKKNEAERLLKNGLFGNELLPIREMLWAHRMKEVEQLCNELKSFQERDWQIFHDKKDRKQRHKKKPATDLQLEKFYSAANGSMFMPFFLIAEFSGCRGDELGKGIRCVCGSDQTGAYIEFVIESSKCDGRRKGLDVRSVRCYEPKGTDKHVCARWAQLSGLIQATGGSYVAQLRPTPSLSPGQRFTRACVDTAKKAGVSMSAYSFRHRVSAACKAQGDAVNTARVLGHQTTETQRFYGRALRGGALVSPLRLVGDSHGVSIRGNLKRQGPSKRPKSDQKAFRKFKR